MKNIKRHRALGAAQAASSVAPSHSESEILGNSNTNSYAKGGELKVVSRNEGSWYFLRFEGAIGSFAWIYGNKYNEGILYPLDDFDKGLVADIKLKKGEFIFRYDTDMMRGRMKPLIKFNLDKSLVYFGVNSDEGEIKFETRGIKLDYIVLEEGYDKIYADGGELKNPRFRVIVSNTSTNNNRQGTYYIETSSKEKAKDIAIEKFKKEFGTRRGVSVYVESAIQVPMLGGKERTRKYFAKLRNSEGSETDSFIIDAFDESAAIKRAFAMFRKKYERPSVYEDDYEVFSPVIERIYPIDEIKQDGVTTYKRTFAKGGKTGFDALSDKVASRYKGKKVDKEYQDEYGKTYDAQEAKEVGDKVAGKVYRQQLAKKAMMAQGGEVEDENTYDFSIRVYKDNLDILNDNPDYEDFRGTKEEVLEKVNDSLEKGEIVYAYIWIENIVTDWYHESGDLERIRMELNRYGEYAKGGKISNYKVGDLVLLKYDIRYGRGDSIPHKIVDIDDNMLVIEDASKFRSKRRVPRARVDSSTIIPFENYEKEKLKIINTYGEGGKAEVYIENKDVKFDKKRYKGLLSDFDLDGLPNVDDPDPFGNQDKQSIEQVKFSNTFNKVLDTKKNLDVELDKFVTKLRNSTTSTEKIYARTKTPFSILNKLVDSRLLDEKRGLKDLVGTTITFKNLQDLERYMQKVVRGDLGKVIDFDDFYKNPNDGYRAYHFIVEQDGIPIELQLKTDRMKEVNILSHEAYKNKTLNKEYMLYLTTLADNADKGSKTAQDQFAEIMQNKGNVRKSLSVKNN